MSLMRYHFSNPLKNIKLNCMKFSPKEEFDFLTSSKTTRFDLHILCDRIEDYLIKIREKIDNQLSEQTESEISTYDRKLKELEDKASFLAHSVKCPECNGTKLKLVPYIVDPRDDLGSVGEPITKFEIRERKMPCNITGKSGSGKTTIANKLPIERIKTVTSRTQRSKEINGEDYYFVSEKQFREFIDKELLWDL